MEGGAVSCAASCRSARGGAERGLTFPGGAFSYAAPRVVGASYRMLETSLTIVP
jgi:hypothetical protein